MSTELTFFGNQQNFKEFFQYECYKLEMPSLPDNDQSCNPHQAALVAINIVTEVLDEAQDIVNKASDSGQPWRCIWRQKKRNSGFYESAEILCVADSKIEETKTNTNTIVTSTPQKESDEFTKGHNENTFIGQGDEDILTRSADMQSPTMLINCLFDMSDLEQAVAFEVTEDVQLENEGDSQDFLACPVTKFVESYITLAVNSACGDVLLSDQEVLFDYIEDKSCSNSAYGDVFTHTQDAMNDTIGKSSHSNSINENISIHGQGTLNSNINTSSHSISACEDVLKPEQGLIKDNIVESSHSSYSFLYDDIKDFNENLPLSENLRHKKKTISQINHVTIIKDNNEDMEEIRKKDIDLYEKTFSTMNRDYDKCLEEDNFEKDLKNVTLQEVDLSTKIEQISNENLNLTLAEQCLRNKEEDLLASKTGTSSNKSSLVKRCRLQGARLLSRLRSWWWKQRLIGRRKGSRSCLNPGMCPLSPIARNRAASLLDHRKLRSPSPTRRIPWKFNTVNEAMIHTYDKNDFNSEIRPSTAQDY